jgi:lipopolysaccharide heptosyltransferase II
MLNQIIREPKKKSAKPLHHAARYLHIADKVGGASVDLKFSAAPQRDGPIRLAICPGAEYGSAKRWQPVRFRRMMQSVSERVDCSWTIFGVEKDREVADEIAEDFGAPCENLVGRTSLAELIDALRNIDVLVSNDTGTMHLAAALGVPVVAIFGSTEPALTAPLGEKQIVIRHQVECSPCFLRECPLDFRCMDAVSVSEVAEAVLQLLGSRVTPALLAS